MNLLPFERLKLIETIELGSNQEKGNLIGIQPYMVVSDYASEESFYLKLEAYFAEAAKRGWINPKSIFVLPEYIGTWLVVAGESPFVFRTQSMNLAMISLIYCHFKDFLKNFFNSPASDRIKYSLFKTKAESMLAIYHRVLSRLAKEHQATVVGGSIVLPEIKIINGAPRITGKKLYNTTLTYRPDGSVYSDVLIKSFPTPQELPFTSLGDEKTLPVYDTPAGRLGVLNCADSWYSGPYQTLKEKGATLLAVPSFVEKDGDMEAPWRGNNITPKPPEFDSKDYHKITYDDAWIKYALPSKVPSEGMSTNQIHTGVNVFLRGKFWNLGSDGRSILFHENQVTRGKHGVGAAIQNVWISGES